MNKCDMISSFTGEVLSLEQFSPVTQIVISVMNLTDILQHGRDESSEAVEIQQNR